MKTITALMVIFLLPLAHADTSWSPINNLKEQMILDRMPHANIIADSSELSLEKAGRPSIRVIHKGVMVYDIQVEGKGGTNFSEEVYNQVYQKLDQTIKEAQSKNEPVVIFKGNNRFVTWDDNDARQIYYYSNLIVSTSELQAFFNRAAENIPKSNSDL